MAGFIPAIHVYLMYPVRMIVGANPIMPAGAHSAAAPI